MPTNATLERVTRDPTQFIDTGRLERIVRQLRAALDSTGPYDVRLAAALHRFVYTKVAYGDELEGGLNRLPIETLRKNGRCADQSLLLVALFRETHIPARITAVSQFDGTNNHAFVEAGFPRAAREALIDDLGRYYRATDVITAGNYAYFDDGSTTYLIADPVSSRYLGDDAGLAEMGYMTDDGSLEINRRFRLPDPDAADEATP